MFKVISTVKAPAAIGPYSQAIVAGDFLFASGQIPINPANGAIEAEGIEAQTEQVMKNIGAILAEAGTDYTHVVKTTCFWMIWAISLHLTQYTKNILPEARKKLCCSEKASQGCFM